MNQAAAIDLFALAASGAGSVLGFVAWRRARAAEVLVGDDPNAPVRVGIIRKLVSPIGAALRPTNQTELEQLQTALLHAGRRNRDAIDRFCEERVLVLLASMVLALVNAALVGGAAGVMLAMLSLLIGIIGPKKMLDLRAADRRDAISQGLPSAIDLLVTCIEAGLSLEQSIARVARELKAASPTLADELHITASEFDAGVALPDALRRLARRVGLDDLSALCGVIAQAHGLGAPIGATLREFAESSRRQRMSMLEERAGKLATQMTVPLALCLLPSSMLVILGPAAIQLVRALQ